MELNLFIIFTLALIFGILFFIEDFIPKLQFKLNKSFIAGISIAYFFLILLPEIAEGLPEFPFHLKIFEFLFILIGFIFIHVSEKMILQKVESKSQNRVRKLMRMEKDLELVERNIENIINVELQQEKLDDYALKDLGRTLTELNAQGEEIKTEIEQKKKRIQMKIERDLSEIHFFTDYIYHFIIGIILISLLIIELISGILFFIFAFFRLIVTRSSDISKEVYSDLGINVKYEESRLIKFILASSVLVGVIMGILFELSLPVNIELVYILYSFISGVILYTIVREVIPEKEKGKPLYFLIGVVGFTLVIFIIRIFTTLIQI